MLWERVKSSLPKARSRRCQAGHPRHRPAQIVSWPGSNHRQLKDFGHVHGDGVRDDHRVDPGLMMLLWMSRVESGEVGE